MTNRELNLLADKIAERILARQSASEPIELLTTDEAAKELKIKRRTLLKDKKFKNISKKKVGRHYLWNANEVRTFYAN